MGTVSQITRAQFCIGDLIHHQLFDYRGVIVDVDRKFMASEAWYQQVARSRPSKNKPWYHVLVDGSVHTTYVAEQNLELDDDMAPIIHPMLDQFFSKLEGGRYVRNAPIN